MFNSYKNWKLQSARSLSTVQSNCQSLFFVTLYVNAKLQFSNFAFPKSTNLGELVVVTNMFWYVISFLLLCSICCVGFVANAVEATSAAKISGHCFCCCSVCRPQYIFTLPRFYGQTLARCSGIPALSNNVTEVALIQWFRYKLGLGLLLLIFLSSCFLNCSLRAALCQTTFHR